MAGRDFFLQPFSDIIPHFVIMVFSEVFWGISSGEFGGAHCSLYFWLWLHSGGLNKGLRDCILGWSLGGFVVVEDKIQTFLNEEYIPKLKVGHFWFVYHCFWDIVPKFCIFLPPFSEGVVFVITKMFSLLKIRKKGTIFQSLGCWENVQTCIVSNPRS